MSHTITVTRIADDPEGDSDDPEYTTAGECDYACLVWYPCKVEGCEAEDEGDFHGVEHRAIGDIEGFCIQSSDCGLTFAYESDNPEFQMTELGTFDVDLTWDGDHWNATLIKREEPANV